MFISFSRVNIQDFSKCRLLQDCCMGKRLNRMEISADFCALERKIHLDLTMSNVWRVAKEKRETVSLMRFLATLKCNVTNEEVTCRKCFNKCTYELEHLLL